MLVDDTANGAFTKGMATRLRAALQKAGASVGWISIKETTAKGLPSTYYADEVSKALGTKPDLVYVSTYFPEGVRIAKALAAAGANPPCLMGLANVDNAFVAQTTLSQAQRCDFSGVPAATEMPSAKTYVGQYRAAFGKKPSVWGSFTYDSARILFRAINRAKSFDFAKVERALRADEGLPRRHRDDRDQLEDGLPQDRSGQHPPREQAKEVRAREVTQSGRCRARTCDLRRVKPLLSQLS